MSFGADNLEMENLSFKPNSKLISTDSAISSIKSGQKVFVHSVLPSLLIDALTARANEHRPM
ncbi:hypothetical protein [Leptospira weilii]|nr:hypothetical protein [Leptospira weilii]OMI15820.1 hypothetical protein BUQ74_18785 [Leptospira weilii serovar Heyan]QDK25127.1 hypothetical protein FHG67_20790 [Leptospira weilii]QDK29031.1 hypothetical protein FHG68_20535 [Leptospira weilii]